ncbi:MAG: hypothetical protein KDI69_03305 [Xanthomonadales bacterium]|nr:hypothetical protein [Xanthomonadales bacterium]
MRISLVTAPSGDVITTDEAKDHVEEVTAANDTKIAAMVAAAVARLDGRDGILGRALLSQTWDMKLDAFPDEDEISIPLPPLQSVTSISYVDGNGDTQTMSTDDYVVDTATQPGVVALAYSKSWPVARSQRNAVTIRFVAGYGAAGAVPAPIKHAILLMVGEMFENREDSIVGLSYAPTRAVDQLLFPYRVLTP